MKIVTLPYRTAIAEATNGSIVYMGETIPVYEEYVQVTPSRPIAFVDLGTDQVKCYIILLNQTSNDLSSKCLRNDEVSIQAQITTEWPSNKGGSKVAEQIANLFIERLFTSDGLSTTIELEEGLSLWMGRLESSNNLNYETGSSRVWITQLLLTARITQS